nr:butyrophilin subfamily 3 member A2-like [Danio rerio]|eukprot:XP_021326533.1 butyrophilin subfamily 3 member A2-like [Danio rerio]
MDLHKNLFVTALLMSCSCNGFLVKGPSGPLVALLGSSVVLPCYVNESLPVKELKVIWIRSNLNTLVHVFQDGESRPDAQYQDYYQRAHFFTEEIQHGNFSLRLDDMRAEDKGFYRCKVYTEQESDETLVQIKAVEYLSVSGSANPVSASVGEDVTLNCSVKSHVPPEEIEQVSWRKTDKNLQLLLFEKNTVSPGDERYRERVEFFSSEISKGNFSVRLRSIRTEDAGVYMCLVKTGNFSASALAVLEKLGESRKLLYKCKPHKSHTTNVVCV